MARLAEEQNRATEEEAQAPTLWTELEQATGGERTPAVDLWEVLQAAVGSLPERARAGGLL